jgi:hypothetical protein
MKVIALLPSYVLGAAFGALGLTACVTNANRCLPGFEYSSSYQACLDLDAGVVDAGPSTVPDAGDAVVSDGASDGEAGEGGGGDTADLGKTCNGASDCGGLSNYCLKSPAAPSSPGYCSVPNCTPAECGASYSCCTCTSAVISQLAALPPVCVQPGDEAQLVSFGCTCQ